MTSISQKTGLPAQGKSNNVQASSQAHSPSPSVSGAQKSFSATVASSDSSNPPASQHGKSASVSTVNGKPLTQQPAVPTAGGVNIVNGNTMPAPTTQGDHTRKPSFTISAAGATGHVPNGSTGGSTRIQFGSQSSPAAGKPATLAQPQGSLDVAQPVNPRSTSPQTSPSPIPQPVLSGGRPPSTLGAQSGPNFGGFGGESPDMSVSDRRVILSEAVSNLALLFQRQMRGAPQGPMGTGPQSQHLRRESSQSAHGDMGNHGMPQGPGRGGYPTHGGGRGRGYNQQYQQQMPYNQNPSFRGSHNGQRGGSNMPNQYHSGRGAPLAPPFNGSPHQATRSPALANSHPVTPQMPSVPMANPQMQGPPYGGYNQHMGQQQVKPQSSYQPFNKHGFPKRKNSIHHQPLNPQLYPPHMSLPPPNLDPESGNFEQYLMMMKNQGFNNMPPQGYDPNYGYYPQGYPVAPMPGMPVMPPSSPRPAYNVAQAGPPNQYMQPGYMGPGQPQGTPMSRNSSQISAPDRPSSSLGQQPAAAPPVSGHTPSASRGSNPSPTPNHNFVKPTKRSPLIIKDPNGTVKTFDKQPASPARATPSPVKVSTPAATPPPPAATRAEHGRSDSKVVKTDEEKKKEMRDTVARISREAEEKAARQKEEESQKAQEEAQRKEKEAAEAKKAEEEKAKPAKEEPKKEEPKAADDDEIDFDAIEKELAEQEAAEAAAEAEYQKKKQAEKEEKARKEKEEAEAYEQNMKKAEREAEAAEEERIKKRAAEAASGKKGDSLASLKNKSETPTSTGSPAIPTPATSGAATPVSDISMGPPAKPSGKQKPAALKLETAKAVEPPQPSAAMKSLQSARFLEDPSRITYPASVVSPNPALNPNAPSDRKFKYNKEFLLQFQSVFKEKPSLDWDSRVRETVGDSSTDTPSGRSQSARTPLMGGRSASRPSAQQSFIGSQMGNFSQTGGRSGGLPAGTTSEQRFALSNAARQTSNPFGQFQRGPGMGMGAPSMSRNNSSAGMQMPSSPRVNASHRGGARSGSRRDKHSAKKEEESNKSMPLTAGLDLKPIQTSSTGWKPRSVGNAGPAPGGDGHMPPDVVQRKVKSNLNKMTPENFEKISDQILEIVGQSKDESDGRTLRQVIQLTFEKATDEAHWAPMYAKFCKRMLESMSPEIKDENIRDRQDQVVTGGSLFRKYLLNRCQEEFERGWKINLPEKPEGVTDEVAMMSDEYYVAAAAKRRGLGLVKFIGELFKLSMLTERIMHACVKKLVDYEGIPEEAEVESLTSLLRTIGYSLDNSEKGPGMMDAYFTRIRMMMETPNLPSRLRFMLMDIVDLRSKRWVSKDSDKGPKTIVEIREEAARAQQEQEMERLRQQANRGGGGRMPMGRGDARNFSGGGYGNQAPPPDFASSKVGTDDLRRLGSKAASARNNNQPMSFGPSSMFGSRSGSGRKGGMGPGGNLVRGDDSGASSRAGTPPGGKKEDKEAASAKNAFSALASLDAGESLATSPPSNPSSPPTTKSRPAKEQPAATEGTS
ncbi:Eukaryotic translation initiation factor 4 gamma [Arachnomyces sp. PD_36]|nr:Eukaryotic translation initiation factor 4 gamma [Arachnomyces sp. PD_36]